MKYNTVRNSKHTVIDHDYDIDKIIKAPSMTEVHLKVTNTYKINNKFVRVYYENGLRRTEDLNQNDVDTLEKWVKWGIISDQTKTGSLCSSCGQPGQIPSRCALKRCKHCNKPDNPSIQCDKVSGHNQCQQCNSNHSAYACPTIGLNYLRQCQPFGRYGHYATNCYSAMSRKTRRF